MTTHNKTVLLPILITVLALSLPSPARAAPGVTITSPQDGDKVRGLVTVSGTLSSSCHFLPTGYAVIGFYANDVLMDAYHAPLSNGEGNFSFQFDTSAYCGKHEVDLYVYWDYSYDTPACDELMESGHVKVKICNPDPC